MLTHMVEASLAEHPAVVLNPRWYELARGASDAPAKLYQEIGRVHLDA